MEAERINKFLLGSTCLLLGVVIGFVLAPIKKGVYCGNHNGNNSDNVYGPDEGRWLEDEDGEEIDDEDDMPF